MSTRILVASGAAVLALVAACSDKSSTSAGGGGSAGPAITISMAGSTLTGAGGRTLYDNTLDTASKISCTGECAIAWPPVIGTPTAGNGVDARKLGTVSRPDGTKQVTYNGHPLYEFKQDLAADDKKGEGIADGGGNWHVATLSQTPPSSAPASDNGGYHY